MIDLTSIIEIVIAIAIIYLFVKFIAFPVVRIILGIIVFLVLIYILQRFFNLNLNQLLEHFGISFDTSKWGLNINWILAPLNPYIDQIKNFINSLWQNTSKSKI